MVEKFPYDLIAAFVTANVVGFVPFPCGMKWFETLKVMATYDGLPSLESKEQDDVEST